MSMALVRIEANGKTFNSWTVIDDSQSLWIVICKCGHRQSLRRDFIVRGLSKCCMSCAHKTHGMEGTAIYYIWAGMKQRCQNPKYHGYARYGGRGIKVCDSWQTFENFYRDMGDPSEGLTLNRKNNDGNYEPSNCEWATKKQQIRNRSNTTMITYKDETRSLAEWGEIIGVNHGAMKARFRKNWPVERLLKGKL